VIFCVIYSLSCFTKLSPNFYVLLFGRLLAGIATSLLFSVPDSWMVCEHNAKGFDEGLLSDTFSWATFGNGLVAIVSGVIANWAADYYGVVAPFMVAIGMFTLAAGVIIAFWGENFGQTSVSHSLRLGTSPGTSFPHTSLIFIIEPISADQFAHGNCRRRR